MKIKQAVERKESPFLPRLRKLVKESPADTIYSCEELGKELGCSRKHTATLLMEAEFYQHRVRDGRRFLYGSAKSLAEFEKARKELLNAD